MSLSDKKISVVVAARNESLHLEEALDSIISQEGINLELIFVDDNSSDETYEIADSFSRTHNNVLVFKNPGKGKCSAFNFGIKKSTGDFVCIFAGDDIMPKGSLRARYSALVDFPSESSVVGLSKIRSFSNFKRFDQIVTPRKSGKGSLSGVSPLMSRTAIKSIFPVPEHLPNEDTWMELAILYSPGMKRIHSDIICCNWRVHDGNSINMTVSFAEYNEKITIRMSALGLFLASRSAEMSAESIKSLSARVECEEGRKAGNIFRIFKSKATFVEKLRALSMCNPVFYRIRVSAFSIFSGW